MRLRRVVLLSLTNFFGGGEIFCLRLARLLQGRVDLSAIIHSTPLYPKLTQVIPTEMVASAEMANGVLKYQRAFGLLRRRIFRDSPSLILLNGQAEANLLPGLKLFPAASVIFRHTSLDLEPSWAKRALYRQNARLADGVVSLAPHIQKQHEPLIPRERNLLIPNWVDDTPAPERPRPGRVLRVAYAGRLVKEKGVLDLLEAAWKLPGVELTLYGDGPLLEPCQERYRNGNIRFAGFCQNLAQEYLQQDLFVLPSYSEAMPLSVLEALNAGVPCLLSDIPAHRTLSADGETALLFETGNVEGLREGLELMRDDIAERVRLGKAGREYVQSEFGEQAARSKYLELIEEFGR